VPVLAGKRELPHIEEALFLSPVCSASPQMATISIEAALIEAAEFKMKIRQLSATVGIIRDIKSVPNPSS